MFYVSVLEEKAAAATKGGRLNRRGVTSHTAPGPETLGWVFIAVRGLSLVVASGVYSLLQCADFSLR